ncbi:MAG: hypothetical protein VW338_14160, partial [Rhodospirillaceae bacterium]
TYIKNELTRRGVPKDEVQFIADHKTHVAKQRLFNDMNTGKVRILIGSTAKMATGVNAQRRLYAVHNLDPLWYPSDDEQRNGRILRQGNQNREIEINDYATKGTYDSTMWGLMETKARFIEGFFAGDPTMRDMEDLGEASQFEQAKALSTADPRLIDLTNKRQELEKLERRERSHHAAEYDRLERIRRAERSIASWTQSLEHRRADLAQRVDTAGDAFKATDAKGKVYDERVEYGAYLLESINKLADRTQAAGKTLQQELGQLGGFDVIAEAWRGRATKEAPEGEAHRALYLQLAGSGQITIRGDSAAGLIASAEAGLRGLESRVADAETALAHYQKQFDDFSNTKPTPFEGKDDIARLRREVDELEAAILDDGKEDEKNALAAAEQAEIDRFDDEAVAIGSPAAERFSIERERLGPASPAVAQDAAAIVKALQARLKQVGIADRIAVRVSEALRSRLESGEEVGAQGVYDPWARLITVALESDQSQAWVLDHEIVHALRDLDLIRKAEWTTLRRAALADTERMDEIRQRYDGTGLSEEELIEEAVADMFADWSAGRMQAGGFIRAAFERLRALLREVARAFSGRGLTAEDVFSRVERGAVGRRREGQTVPEGIDEPGPMGISEKFARVFHGSPHDFDRFDIGKIGTGEGNQTFGWGLYFASRKGVAEYYKNILSRNFQMNKGWTTADVIEELNQVQEEEDEFSESYTMLDYMHEHYMLADYDDRNAFAFADGMIVFDKDGMKYTVEDLPKPSGKLYKVNLAPAEDEYLYWDKPLSEQSEKVRGALEKALGRQVAEWRDADGVWHGTGEDVYGWWAQNRKRNVFKEHIKSSFGFDRPFNDKRGASLDFLAAGIPGIKYLDQGTRSFKIEAPENRGHDWLVTNDRGSIVAKVSTEAQARAELDRLRSYNYVIFDDSLISVESKFSLPRRQRPTAAPATPAPTFDNAETEARYRKARQGVGNGESLIKRATGWWEYLAQGMSRHHIHLPNTARFSDVAEQFRKLEAAPQASKERIVRILRSMTDGMNAADLDLFTRKVMLDDLAWEAEQGRALPFGLSAEDAPRELAKIDRVLDGRPDIVDAVRRRKLVVAAVARDLVDAGVLNDEQIRNPSYYRHVVLEYAQAEASRARGTGKRVRSPYWAQRLGSHKDINANLLEAELDWLMKAMNDIATARTIEWLKNSEHNIRGDVVAAGRAANEGAVRAKLESDQRENGFIDAQGRQSSPLTEEWNKFRQRIGMGMSRVRQAVEEGDLGDVPRRFEGVVDDLSTDAAVNSSDLFPFLAWMLDNDKPGAEGAAQVFKALNARKAWTKELLGKAYVDTTQVVEMAKRGLAPEGYVAWQPEAREGESRAVRFFTAKTISEHAIDRFVQTVIGDMPLPESAAADVRRALEAEAREVLAVGGERYAMVLPAEIADTLNEFSDPHADALVASILETPVRYIKRWWLINPRRVTKYNINNLSGDLDAVIAGNPKALRRMGQAMDELYNVMYAGQAPTDRYREAVDRGVFDSGLTVQEIPDINVMDEFSHLIEKPGFKQPGAMAKMQVMRVWKGLQRFTQWRENWLRYAAYLDYIDRLEGGESMESIGYGAARKDMVDAIPDVKDKAAKLARELVGDYGAISHLGRRLRSRAIPFWSWNEINTKRYWRLTLNAWHQGAGKGIATGGALAISAGVRRSVWLFTRMAILYGLVNLWNHLFWPDEERELSVEEQTRLHIILGRDDTGEVVTLKFQGAFSDVLAWFGFGDAIAAIDDVEKGRASPGKIIEAVAKAPVKRLVPAMTPVITMPYE